jgi:hypothetical protein
MRSAWSSRRQAAARGQAALARRRLDQAERMALQRRAGHELAANARCRAELALQPLPA